MPMHFFRTTTIAAARLFVMKYECGAQISTGKHLILTLVIIYYRQFVTSELEDLDTSRMTPHDIRSHHNLYSMGTSVNY